MKKEVSTARDNKLDSSIYGFKHTFSSSLPQVPLKRLEWLFTASVCLFSILLLFLPEITIPALLATGCAITYAVRSYKVGRFVFSKEAIVASILLTAFMASALISCLINPETLRNYPRILLWPACWITGYAYAQKARDCRYAVLHTLVWTLVASILVIIPVGVAFVMMHPLLKEQRLQLFTSHPARLATLAALGSLLCAFEYLGATRRQKTAWGIGMLFCFGVIFATNARILIFATALVIPLFITTAAQFSWQRKLAIGGIFLLVVIGTVGITKETQSTQRFINAFSNFEQDATLRSRLPIWEVAVDTIREHPLFGVGIRGYRNAHISIEAERREEWKERYGTWEKRVKNAHNVVLGRLADTGGAGTLFFFGFFGYVAWHVMRHSDRWSWGAYFLLLLLIDGLVDDPFYPTNSCFIFMLAGLCLPQPTASSPIPEATH